MGRDNDESRETGNAVNQIMLQYWEETWEAITILITVTRTKKTNCAHLKQASIEWVN